MSTVPPEGTPDPIPDSTVPPAGSNPPPPAYEAPAAPPPYAAAPPPPAYGQPAYGAPAAAPLSPSDERLWATLAHVGGILFSFVAPLVIWLVFRERSRFVDEHGKEALNFQILVTIVYIVSSILFFVVIGFVTFAIAWIGVIVFGIQGAIAANKGAGYRYPVNWRIIK